MTINGKAYAAWTKASMDMWMLGAEAGSVMALRMRASPPVDRSWPRKPN